MKKWMETGSRPAALVIVALLALATAGGAAGAPARKTAPSHPIKSATLKTDEAARQGWLGVNLQDIEAEMAQALDLPDGEGALVSGVVDDSPAAEAGIEHGDVIVRFDGRRIGDADALTEAVRAAKPGEKVAIVALRDGKEKDFDVTMGERPAQSEARIRRWVSPSIPGLEHERQLRLYRDRDAGGDAESEGEEPSIGIWTDEPGAFLGVRMTQPSEQLRRYFGAPEGEGALIDEVVADSPAETAGLQAGDVILRVGSRAVDGPAAVRRALGKAEPGDKRELTVLREHAQRTFEVTLGEPPEGELNRFFKQHRSGDDNTGFFMHRRAPAGKNGKERDIIVRKLGPGTDPTEMKELRDELKELREEVARLREDLDQKR